MKNYGKVFTFIIILILGIFLNRRFQLGSHLSNIDNFVKITRFVDENHILSISLYLIFTILGSSILALPGVTFAVVGSGLFGPWLGSFYCLIGTTIGALFSFLLSRYFLRDYIKELVKKNKKLYDIIFKMDSDKEILILMITRLLPIFPFNLQNFAYGVTDISTVKYTLGSFIFTIPGIIIFSIGTDGIINKSNRFNMLVIGLLILVCITIIGIFLYKRYRKLMTEG